MAQAIFDTCGDKVQFTNGGSARAAGDVVVSGSLVGVTPHPVAASAIGTIQVEGVFKMVKDATVTTVGAPAYWLATGDPYGGTAGSGAATMNPTNGAVFCGYFLEAAGATTGTVLVSLASVRTHRMPVATVAATGSALADAAQLAEGFTLVTGADATKGVKLPPAGPGKIVLIKNADAANAVLKIWPNAAGEAINAITAGSAYSAAAKVTLHLVCYDTTTWYTLPLLGS